MNLLHIVSLISLWCPKKADTIRITIRLPDDIYENLDYLKTEFGISKS
jgi:hypothetical protein